MVEEADDKCHSIGWSTQEKKGESLTRQTGAGERGKDGGAGFSGEARLDVGSLQGVLPLKM